MWAKIQAVWSRELLDTVRDKRTLYMMVLLPIILMPLMMAVGPLMMVRQQEAIQETVPVMSLVGGEQIGRLPEWIDASGLIEVEAVSAGLGADGHSELEQRLRDESIDLIVYVDEHADELLASERPVPFEVVFNSTNRRSAMAMQRFDAALEAYRVQVVNERLTERGLSPELTRPFAVTERRNVAPEEKLGAQILGMIVPFFIAVWAVAGGMYTAIDAAAGEKERNSLESLVMAPVPASVLVIGKFLAITTVTLVAVILLIVSSSISMLYIVPRLLGEASMLSTGLTFSGLVLLLVVMALFVALMAAIQLGMSVFSKSYREAQAYMTGLMFVVMLPAMYLMFLEETGAALWAYFVPVLNVLLVASDILDGGASAPALLATIGSLAVLAALALWGTLRAFRHERVVFRT